MKKFITTLVTLTLLSSGMAYGRIPADPDYAPVIVSPPAKPAAATKPPVIPPTIIQPAPAPVEVPYKVPYNIVGPTKAMSSSAADYVSTAVAMNATANINSTAPTTTTTSAGTVTGTTVAETSTVKIPGQISFTTATNTSGSGVTKVANALQSALDSLPAGSVVTIEVTGTSSTGGTKKALETLAGARANSATDTLESKVDCPANVTCNFVAVNGGIAGPTVKSQAAKVELIITQPVTTYKTTPPVAPEPTFVAQVCPPICGWTPPATPTLGPPPTLPPTSTPTPTPTLTVKPTPTPTIIVDPTPTPQIVVDPTPTIITQPVVRTVNVPTNVCGVGGCTTVIVAQVVPVVSNPVAPVVPTVPTPRAPVVVTPTPVVTTPVVLPSPTSTKRPS